MSMSRWLLIAVGSLAWAAGGCVSVQAPERVEVSTGRRVEPVDSSRIPATASHEEARAELRKAYAYIQDLERRNAELGEKATRYKNEREKCEDRLEACEEHLKKLRDRD